MGEERRNKTAIEFQACAKYLYISVAHHWHRHRNYQLYAWNDTQDDERIYEMVAATRIENKGETVEIE